MLNCQKHVLAVFFGDVEGITVDVLASNRQGGEFCENMPPDHRQLGGIIGADVKHRRFWFYLESIKAYREEHDFPGAARGFVQALGVGVEAGWCRCVDVTHMLGVEMIGGGEIGVISDIGFGKVSGVEFCQNGLRVAPKPHAEMVNQFNLASFVNAGEQRQLSEGGTAAD